MKNLDIDTSLFLASGVCGAVMAGLVACWARRFLYGRTLHEGRSYDASIPQAPGAVASAPASGRAFPCEGCASRRLALSMLVGAATFASLVLRYGPSLETVELLAFSCVLLFLSLVDIDAYVIPNGCLVVGLLIRLLYLALSYAQGTMALAEVVEYVASGLGVGVALLVMVVVADRLLGKDSMGGGDLKLFALAALYVGWQQSLLLVVVSCVLGLVAGVVIWPALRGRDAAGELGGDASDRTFPFGPSIALSCVITFLWGSQVVGWYQALFLG